MTRGRCGSLPLHRVTLSFTTPRRFNPAHGGTDMKLPSRIVDLSMPLDNETTCDPDIMRPKIQYVSQKDNAEGMAAFFEGMRAAALPHGEGWAWEVITLTTHNGTHMDAPWHYHSRDRNGKPMQTVDQLPLDWFFRPGVKLDFR